MRIGIDLRPLQLDAYKERGIGTHLRNWIQAAQGLASPAEYRLLFDPALPAPRLHLSSPLWQLHPIGLPFSPPEMPITALHIDPDSELVFDSAMEAFLIEAGIELFHATYTLMWEAFSARRLYRTRWVATFYDLIPLAFYDEYLGGLGERGRQSFAQRLSAAVYAQRVQTISRASQADLVKTSRLDPDKIDVIYGGVDPSFAPLGAAEVEKQLADTGIHAPYLFSVVGFHHTKNMRRTLEAYHLLPDALRQAFSLVIRCPLSQADRALLQDWLNELNIQDRVKLLPHVTQPQLVALYNGAALLLHPSLYEGFGLPVLEAMRCGTPVVTSITSSMPEIAGSAAELVDPYQASDIARGIARVLGSPSLQAELRERGLAQAAPFTWERTAAAVLESYAKAAEAPLYTLERVFPASFRPSARRLRLAFWTPLNPRPSGVSDYSEHLIAELGKHADVDIFVDGYQLANLPLFDSFPTFDAKAYPALHSHSPYDMNLYQVGNNPLHRYMYTPILTQPGIITLHDFYIYHFIHAALMTNGHAEKFWQEVTCCEGSDLARKAQVDYMMGKLDDYLLPLNKHIVQSSRGVVAHSQWSIDRVKQYPGAPPARVIHFGLPLLEDDGGRFGQLVRRLLGLPSDGFIFGVFGNIHRVKRMPVVFEVFARLHNLHPNTALFIMGPVDGSAAEAIEPWQRNPRQARAQGIYLYLNYASYELMLMAMQAVDAGINLRYPTAGETSGTLSMLLGQGKPSLVSEVGSFVEYPDACCPKVPVDATEEQVLFKHMLALVRGEHHYRQAVQSAHAYSQDKSWPACAQSYLDFIDELLGGKK
ncbi:MAG: glycosyltransferase [Thermoflexales bacterium]|nr:glycosyltransferase [Thermoflexales bacterium]